MKNNIIEVLYKNKNVLDQYSDGYKEEDFEDLSDVLNTLFSKHIVSQQRELLKFFSSQLSENLDIDVGINYITEEDIEECLKNFNFG